MAELESVQLLPTSYDPGVLEGRLRVSLEAEERRFTDSGPRLNKLERDSWRTVVLSRSLFSGSQRCEYTASHLYC
ncbi:rCG41140 [Rattus norvegicus]|uniref:RCG41140 n=1 Tax=Rattus norvegicus TaxID=10116 RepID=A6KIQ4_RAT|nr:rCG41140 [Rattus norvegicus]